MPLMMVMTPNAARVLPAQREVNLTSFTSSLFRSVNLQRFTGCERNYNYSTNTNKNQ